MVVDEEFFKQCDSRGLINYGDISPEEDRYFSCNRKAKFHGTAG